MPKRVESEATGLAASSSEFDASTYDLKDEIEDEDQVDAAEDGVGELDGLEPAGEVGEDSPVEDPSLVS